MRDADTILCPYCATRFRFDPRLTPFDADPRTASLLSVLIPGEDNSPNPVSRKFPAISDQLLCGTVLLDATCGVAIGVDRLGGVAELSYLAAAFRGVYGRPGQFYPAVAVFWPALISFCTQISAAPATGSVLPGIVAQPFFTSIWLPS